MYDKQHKKRLKVIQEDVSRALCKEYEDYTDNLSLSEAAKMGRYVSLEYIEKNPHIDWDYREVTRNSQVTLEYIMKNTDKNWDWDEATYLLKDYQVLYDNPDLPWNMALLSRSAPLDFILRYRTKLWYWGTISSRPDITRDILLENINLPWDPSSFNGDMIDSDLVYDLEQLSWNWFSMEEKSYFHWDLVRYLPEKHWDWNSLSYIKDIPGDIYLDNLDKDWNIEGVIKNIKLSESDKIRIKESKDMDMVKYKLLGENVEEKVAFDIFDGRGGEDRKAEIKLSYYKQHMSAYKIQNLWRRIMNDKKHPLYKSVCEKNAYFAVHGRYPPSTESV